MKAVKEQVTSCSTFARLKQYHDASLTRWELVVSAGESTEIQRQRQRALDEKRYTSDMLARHEVECPICRLERRSAA
jgi:hypothetical protein